MEFELQYELDEFKEIQEQYFDEDGKCYTGINISTDIMEKMLKLIDNLSERVNELEPVIKQQIKKSLPIHGVTINEVALPIGTEVIFEGKQRFITKYAEYNKQLGYRLNGTEETELFLKTDFEEILE